jgi:hypothetical protein
MKQSTFLKFALTSILFLSTMVHADDGYEEVTYDDLISQINKQKKVVSQAVPNRFDELKIRAGFALITSVNSVKVNNQDLYKYQNGFQISLGIDLFSTNFASEAVLRNFGQTRSSSETRSLREFDLKFYYHDFVDQNISVKAGAGIGNRNFKLSDPVISADINDSTPISIFFGGMDAHLSKNLSMGIEFGLRSAMVTTTADKNAMDISFRLDTAF